MGNNCCGCCGNDNQNNNTQTTSTNNAASSTANTGGTDLETGTSDNGATNTGAGSSSGGNDTEAKNDSNDNDNDTAVTTGNSGNNDDNNNNNNENNNNNDNNVEPPPQESKDNVDVVTRYEIREMTPALQKRFFDAIDKMMENKDGVPGTSEFYRCAGYHGSPPPIYCKHGRETFPGWHRIYLLDFEKALRAADRALGNDGNIGLPYWDWSVRPQDGLPSIVRERFAQWPNGLFPPNLSGAPTSLIRASDSQISTLLQEWNVIGDARDCLLATQHFAHASTGGQWASNYPSVETPHNSVHSIVGGNGGVMGGVAWAAFDIAFWLHHCNVDRIYETYLQMEPDSKDEFEANQNSQRNDLFDEAFEPFLNENGEPYYPHDTFDARKLGFVYNTPWPVPSGQQLRLAPTVAMFVNVKVSEFESKCYQIHVFVINKNEEEKFEEPQRLGDIDFTSDNYGGGASIFGRGMECENCVSRPPYDIIVDITKTLGKLQLSRYDAKLKVYCLETTETTDELLKLSDTPLPEPVITGPLFEDTETQLEQSKKDTQNAEEVRALQRYLNRFGYYDDELDGSYGPITEKAVKVYQTATGTLEVDGLAGPLTKKSIRELRRCSNKDPFGDNKVKDDLIDEKSNSDMYNGDKSLTYHIDVAPGYLKRKAVEACIERSFKLWSDATNGNVTFKMIDNKDKDKADIKLSWSTGSMRNGTLMQFDGAGGVLGHGGTSNNDSKGFVVFDKAERWVIGYETDYNKNEMKPSDVNDPSTWYRGSPTISLFYTATHEIGHALGLDHSIDSKDFMSPFYDTNKQALSANDIARIKQSFNV